MGYIVTITREPMQAIFDLIGSKDAISDWCGAALPDFPVRPNSLTATGHRKLMWIGPDHWLLAAPLAEEDELAAALRPRDAPESISIVVLSDTLTFFTVEGPDMAEIMAVATPLDLHPSAFFADSVSQTEAFGTKALIRRTAAGFELAVDRSYGDWFAACLDRSAS